MNESELYQYAMFMLSRRDYGTAELHTRMKRRMYEKNEGIVDDVLIEKVLSHLSEQQLLDDQRVLALYLRGYIRKGYGPLRIKQELRQKGFLSSLIDSQFENIEVDWFELATEVRHKKFGEDIPQDFKEKGKQIRYLQYRGFSGDMIFEQFN